MPAKLSPIQVDQSTIEAISGLRDLADAIESITPPDTAGEEIRQALSQFRDDMAQEIRGRAVAAQPAVDLMRGLVERANALTDRTAPLDNIQVGGLLKGDYGLAGLSLWVDENLLPAQGHAVRFAVVTGRLKDDGNAYANASDWPGNGHPVTVTANPSDADGGNADTSTTLYLKAAEQADQMIGFGDSIADDDVIMYLVGDGTEDVPGVAATQYDGYVIPHGGGDGDADGDGGAELMTTLCMVVQEHVDRESVADGTYTLEVVVSGGDAACSLEEVDEC